MSNGPSFTEFGDVVSSALKFEAHNDATHNLNNNYSVCLGQIMAVYPAGNTKAPEGTRDYTTYDVRIQQADGVQELIPFCRMVQPGFGGGINNFMEVLPTDPGPKAKDPKVDMRAKPGHMVLVAFISGQKSGGVILGAMPHANKVAVKSRPAKDKGVHLEGEVQGLGWQVTNDGELKVKFQGPRKEDGSLVQADVGPTDIEIDKSGNIRVSTNAQQSVVIDRTTKKITITNGGTSITMDQDAGKIQVVAGVVEVGTGGLQPQVVGDDMVAWLKDLVDAITQIYVPTGVGPSGTPLNAAKFKSLASQLKDKILSTKHKVEK